MTKIIPADTGRYKDIFLDILNILIFNFIFILVTIIAFLLQQC